MKRRLAAALLTLAAIATGAAGIGGSAFAEETNWPEDDITIVVPFKAGGDTDFHARNLASYLGEILDVNVIVENVDGANGSTGMLQVMDSDPDGYTCLFFHADQ